MIPVLTCDTLPDELKKAVYLDHMDDDRLSQSVREIVRQVRYEGDQALKALAERFGDPHPKKLMLDDPEVKAAIDRIPSETKTVLTRAAENIRCFAQAIMDQCRPVSLDRDGFQVGMDYKPVSRVACYVPGGRYPLPSTALMTAMTARVAGVEDIWILSPVLKDEVLYAGSLSGVSGFYQLGGAQAVAAVAFGTASIDPVDMIVGPGNAYVTEAKRQLQGIIGIDMLAGPSEVAIIADNGANPHWLALDMLAQAEHDPNARAYLFTNSSDLAHQVKDWIERLKQDMALPEFLRESMDHSAIYVFPSLEHCVDASNVLAPEHLELQVSDPVALKSKLTHYGALFMGYAATVPFGDYMAGPNHTLPTGRTARFAGGLTPLTFLRPQSWIKPGSAITSLAEDTYQFATLEGLVAHAQAAKARL